MDLSLLPWEGWWLQNEPVDHENDFYVSEADDGMTPSPPMSPADSDANCFVGWIVNLPPAALTPLQMTTEKTHGNHGKSHVLLSDRCCCLLSKGLRLHVSHVHASGFRWPKVAQLC